MQLYQNKFSKQESFHPGVTTVTNPFALIHKFKSSDYYTDIS